MKRKLAILTCIAMIITLLPTYAMALDEGQGDDADLALQVTDEEQIDNIGLKQPPKEKPDDADLTPSLKPEGQNAQVKDSILNLRNELSAKSVYWDEDYTFIEIFRPVWDEVIYRGELLYTDYWQYDTYKDYWTCPIEVLWDLNDNVRFYEEYPDATVGEDDWEEWYGPVDIGSWNLSPGIYEFWVLNAPVDDYGYIPEDLESFEIPYDYMTIIVKNFYAPTGLKAKAGKKKVTVSFKGSSGATAYQIYRSKKKGSGYKLIATTGKTKYVDKKVKKGKKYYYKVRAVRKAQYKNAIYSGLTGPKKTKKVK